MLPKLPKLIDTHAHLDIEPLSHDIDGVIRRAKDAGVEKIITIGIDLKSSRKAIEIATAYEGVYATVGVHPHDAKHVQERDFSGLERLLSAKKVVALGEIGLDYAKEYSPKAVQQQVFLRQLELAKRLSVPIVIHSRDAHDDTVRLVRSVFGGVVKGVMHCFSGDVLLAKICLDMGLYLSIPGVVTFSKAETLKEVARFAPIDRLLVETDCPYLAPVPFRGKTNEPAYVKYVAQEVARLKKLELEEVAQCTSENVAALFAL